MTGPDLIRLAEELARCGGTHRLTTLITAAVHVTLDHARRARLVEAWEDGPHGVGMSDKVAGALACPECGRTDGCCWVDLPHGWCQFKNICWTRQPQAPSRAPEREGWVGRPTDYPSDRCGSTGAETAAAQKLPLNAMICACGVIYEPPHSHECDAGRFQRAINPAPVMPERGERVPLPLSDCQGEYLEAKARFSNRQLLFERLSKQQLDAATRADDPEHCGGPDGKELESPTRPVGEPINPMEQRNDTAASREKQPTPLRTGNALAEERGVTHAPDSPVLTRAQSDFGRRVPRRYMPPVNPELTDGDGA